MMLWGSFVAAGSGTLVMVDGMWSDFSRGFPHTKNIKECKMEEWAKILYKHLQHF